MIPADVEVFLASLKRCLARPDFLARFYEGFMASSEEVREKFRNTDMKRQVRMLEDSLFVVAVAVQGGEGSLARADLPRIAARHGRKQLDIRPELYDLWSDCLLTAARQHDPAFDDGVDRAGREVLGFGVRYMREHSD